MVKKNLPVAIPEEDLMGKIYVISEKNIMFDRDLAELYEVENKRFKESVSRNMDRFPEDFMFELSEQEHQYLKSLIVISN